MDSKGMLALPSTASSMATSNDPQHLVDALPYLDNEPSAEDRQMALQLIEVECRTFRPTKDYLARLSKPNFDVFLTPCLIEEYKRIGNKQEMDKLDMSRYEMPSPANTSRSTDKKAWIKALDNGKAQLEHLHLRNMNVEIMDEYASESCLQFNKLLEQTHKKEEAENFQIRTEVLETHVRRKRSQLEGGDKLKQLGQGWVEHVTKNYKMELANLDLERQINNLAKKLKVDPETYENETETYNEIVERISDEFRFLEERRAFSQKDDLHKRTSVRFPLRYRQYLFATLAILQIVVSIGMFIFAITRYSRLFTQNAHSDMLFDFVKAENFVDTNQEGAEIIAIKLGSGLFLPAIFQLISGIVVLGSVYKKPPPTYLLVLCILLTIFSIVLWIEPLVLATLELNLRHIQFLSDETNIAYFRLMIVLTVLLAIDVLIVASMLLIYATAQFTHFRTIYNSIMDLHINIVTLIIATIALVLSIYSLANSMTDANKWRNSSRNTLALYGIGLRESILTSYIFLGSLFSMLVSAMRLQTFRFSTFFIQGLSLFMLISNLLNSDRITSVTHNVRVMLNVGTAEPFTGEILLLLYVFVLLLAIAILVQLFTTTFNIFKHFLDNYETPRKLSYPEYQRSAL
uniref:Pre-mRNA-splicing factor SPF27 n=1 Tax=Acrobeloides nanus TaxID=290746 RepID=A0A914BW01_9BILA